MHPKINKFVLPVLTNEIFTNREELLEHLKFRAMNTRFQRTTSFALLGHRRVGKTEVLKRLYNNLFWEQDEVVPIYITYDDLNRQADQFAEEYFFSFLLQYVAFKKKNPTLMASGVDAIQHATDLIDEAGNEGLRLVVQKYLGAKKLENVGFRLRTALQGPRAVADWNEEPILMIIDEFQHVINIRDKDGSEPNVVGRYQHAVESRWCPHLVSGSAVTLLTKDILGRGSLYGRFRWVYIYPLEGFHAIELCHRLSKFYSVPINDDMAAEIARRTGGNPFYLDCIVQWAQERNIPLTTPEAVSDVIAQELTQGGIWSELYRQLNYYFRTVNKYGITRNIFYFASRYQNRPIDAKAIAKKIKPKKITVDDVFDVLMALSRADLIEESMDGMEFYNVKDPIMREFIDAWARVEVENDTWEDAGTELAVKYRTLSGEYANFRGYAAELFVKFLMTRFDSRRVDGTPFFNTSGKVTLPKFTWVDTRKVKLTSTREYELDAVGVVVPKLWVVEVKFTNRRVGVKAIRKFARAAQVAVNTWKSEELTGWYISKSGFTTAAESELQAKGFLYSTWEQVNQLLQLFGLRTLSAE